MYCGSPSSVTQAENCAESATTVAPQIAGHDQKREWMRAEQKANHQTATAADRSWPPKLRWFVPTRSAINPAITQPAAPQPITRNDATSASDGIAATRTQTGANHERNPRPHRVELPHVTKVTEIRETHAAIVKDSANLLPIKSRGRQSVWTIADKEQRPPGRQSPPALKLKSRYNASSDCRFR